MGCVLTGCASTLPTWSGGSATPSRRGDVALGGSVRVPVGALRDLSDAESRYREEVEAGGIVPAAMARYGIGQGQDVGLLVAGTTARLEYRREFGAREAVTRPTWLLGVALIGGPLTEDAEGGRFGFDVPLIYGIDFGGLYEFWVGPRVGFEHLRGRFPLVGSVGDTTESGHASTLRAGATFGLAAGFRRVHAFLELSALYEYSFVQHGERSLDRGGLVLMPSFGLRVRI